MTDKQNSNSGLLPALLKYWRNSRGLSQLDLSLAADVSARHISFLETGRAKPSQDLLLALASTLQVPMREQNTLLQAAGFTPLFEEPGPQEVLAGPMGKVIDFMLSNHDPYPMVIMDWTYNLINLNKSAMHLFAHFPPKEMRAVSEINLFEAVFDPNQLRDYVVNWEITAHHLLVVLHRLALLNSHDGRLAELLDKLLSYPDVPGAWKQPDFCANKNSTLTVELKNQDLELSFMTTVTGFNAPQNITLEEIRIESYIPLNETTDTFFKALPI